MTDPEIIERCAVAMGKPQKEPLAIFECEGQYDPLRDDAQAMRLLKRFGGHINSQDGKIWCVEIGGFGIDESTDLNRAICECVANRV